MSAPTVPVRPPRTALGLAVGPLFPVLAWVAFFGLFGGVEAMAGASVLALVFAVPVSYGTSLALAGPVIWILHARGRLTLAWSLAVGPLVALPLALLMVLASNQTGPDRFLYGGLLVLMGALFSVGFAIAAWSFRPARLPA